MKLFLSLMLLASTAFAQVPPAHAAQTASVAYSQAVGAIPVGRSSDYGMVSVVTVTTPSAGAFTCAASNICTKAAHGMLTGLKVTLTTSAADLPDPLMTGTDYFVIALSASTFSLAADLPGALAGTAIDITDAGTGTHTITPTALAGASVKLQVSQDNSNWSDLPIAASGDASNSQSITATGNFYLYEYNLSANYIRVYYTLTAGQFTVSQIPKVSNRFSPRP